MKLLCSSLVLLHLYELAVAKDGHLRIRGLQNGGIDFFPGISDGSDVRKTKTSDSGEDNPNDACCGGVRRPSSLRFLFTGKSCNSGSSGLVRQGTKAMCEQFGSQVNLPSGDTYTLKASTKDQGEITISTNLTINEAFDVSFAEFSTESFLTLISNSKSISQKVEYHTSCSAPLLVGDEWGALQLINYRYASARKVFVSLSCTLVF